ncbi:MAG: radical SAM protein [Dehalococcoidia bacterium]|nr:radical SAM protein [Dehalococcoidia bacterium]
MPAINSHMRDSPAYLQTSLAAAMALGFRHGRFYRDVSLTCINLLLTYGGGCRANCAFCGLAQCRPGETADKSFIRVEWPLLSTDALMEGIARHRERLKRVCLSMVTHPRAYRDTVKISRNITAATGLPLSALITPTLVPRGGLEELKDAGVGRIGVGLDAASARVFHRTKGRGAGGPHRWERYWEVIQAARDLFGPWTVSCHIIVGIGETDRELVELFMRLKGQQVWAHLFSFYPEPDSAMGRRQRPSLVRWRRLQLARYLLETGQIGAGDLTYNTRGFMSGIGASAQATDRAIGSGLPFITGGCPGEDGALGCTRPFGSYRPGQPFRDFPFMPDSQDISRIKRELRLDRLRANSP